MMRSTDRLRLTAVAACAASVLAACGGGSTSTPANTGTTPGTLIYNPPPRLASLNATDLATQFGATSSGQQLLAVAGTPKCGVDFHYFQYQTVGAKGEHTTASGAIMAPTGSATGCSGALPILLYTHGTAATRSYNIAYPGDATNEAWSTAAGGSEGPIVAAMFAAQGYIVVASNYAGYDSSPLPYHPYLVGDQQAQDVINALSAARTALKGGLPSGVTDNGKLFITGYSQGGYVAMATYRAMQAASMPVTAVSPMSGPYALEAFGDASVFGEVTLGSTVEYPFVINAYQNAYGDLYSSTSDIFSATYASGIDTLLPGNYTFSSLVSAGKVPQTALFSSAPTGDTTLDGLTALITSANQVAALGFGNPYLINNSVRLAYAADALADPDHGLKAVLPFSASAPWNLMPDFGVSSSTPTYPLRKHLRENDLRTNWAPSAPMLMCGGHDDPEVPYVTNTGVFEQFWAPYISTVPFGGVPNNLVTVLDVDPADPTVASIQSTIASLAATAFATDLAQGASAAKIATDVQAAVIGNFAAHFNLTGATPVPIDPQGIFVAALGGVAAQAVVTYYAEGVTNPTTMGNDVALATLAYTHFPSEQVACEVAARAFFDPLR